MSGVAVQVESQSDQAKRDLAKINEQLSMITKGTQKATEAFTAMAKGIALSVVSVSSFRAIASVSDEFTNLANKIALVTGRTNDMIYAQKKLLDLSEDTRSSIENSADTFNTFGRALKNAPIERILAVTKTVQEAVAVSGAGAESARAAIIQLGQGLASGTLRGEELNSVMEQTPRIAQAIADSLKITTAQLRNLAADGKITSDVVFKGLLDQAQAVNKEFKQMTPTMAQGMTLLRQSSHEWMNELIQGLSLSDNIGSVLTNVAHKIRENAKYIGIDAAVFAASIRSNFNDFMLLANPVLDIVKELGKGLVAAIPKGFFTRTLKGDMGEALRQIDDFAGGAGTALTRLWQYGLKDFMEWDSPIEAAFKRIYRIGPWSWATGGLDVQTLNRFFSRKTLVEYADALQELSAAVADNFTSMGAWFNNFRRTAAYDMRDAIRYLGLFKDTFITIRLGLMDPLVTTFYEIGRGALLMQRKITDIATIIGDNFGETSIMIVHFFQDSFKRLFAITANAVKFILDRLQALATATATIFSDMWGNTEMDVFFDSIKSTVSKLVSVFRSLGAANPLLALSKAIGVFNKELGDTFAQLVKGNFLQAMFTDITTSAVKMANTVSTVIHNFAAKVIHWFWWIYDDVIAHSWWTDLIDGVVDQAKGLLGRVTNPFNKFVNFVSGSFSSLYDEIVGSNWMDKLMNAYLKSVAERTIKFKLTWDPSMMQQMIHQFDSLTYSVITKALDMASKVEVIIREFAKKVVYWFFWIYDEVIAHSWWTDTMDGVVNQAKSLIPRAGRHIDQFASYVNNVFKSIFTTFSKKNFAKLFTFDTSITSSIQNGLSKAIDGLKDNVANAVKLGLTGAAGLAIALLFPAGTVKKVLLYAILESLITNGLVLGEAASNSLFGTGFLTSASYAIGKVVGEFTATFIREIPEIVNALSSIISGFVQGFSEQVPVIGGLIKGLFSISEIFGVAGPLGIIGLAFLGTNGGLDLLKNFKMLEGPVGWLSSVFTYFQTFGQAKDSGLISKFLFGAFGPTRLIAGVGAILSMMGAFDSIFAGAEIAKLAANGGLLMMLLMGSKAKNVVVDSIIDKITVPLGDAAKKILQSPAAQSVGGDLIYKFFFGGKDATGFAAQALSMKVAKYLDLVSDKIVQYGAKYIRTGMDFISVMLFGEDGKSLTIIKSKVGSVVDAIKDQFIKLGQWLLSKDIFASLWEGKNKDGGLKGIATKIAGFFGKKNQTPVAEQMDLFSGDLMAAATATQPMSKQMNLFGGIEDTAKQTTKRVVDMSSAAMQQASAIGGETGIIGKVFFGKFGRLALVGLALAAFAGIASAADTQVQTSYSATEEGFRAMGNIIKRTFDFSLLEIAAWSAGVYVAIKGVKIAWAAMLDLDRTKAQLDVIGQMVEKLNTRWGKQAKGALMGAALGGAAGGALGGDWESVLIGAGAVSALTTMFIELDTVLKGGLVARIAAFGASMLEMGGIIGAVVTAIKAIMAVLMSTIGFVIVAVAALGAAMIYAFGEGNGFVEKAQDIWTRFAKSVGLVNSELDATNKKINGLMDQKERTRAFKIDYDVGKIDFKKVDQGSREHLEKIIGKLKEEEAKANEEKLSTGTVSDGTYKNLTEINKQLGNYITKLEALNKKSFFDDIKDVNASNQGQYGGLLGRGMYGVGQWWDSLMYKAKETDIRQKLKKDPTNVMVQQELKDLQKERDTKFKFKYVPADDFTEKVQKMYDKLDSNVDLIGDINMSESDKKYAQEVIAKSESTFDKMIKANRELASSKKGWFMGGGNATQIAIRQVYADQARGDALSWLNKRLDLQEKRKQIEEFQKSLRDVDAAMKDAGITFEDSPIFTAGSDNYEFIKGFVKEAQEASKAITQARNADEAMLSWRTQRDAANMSKMLQRQGSDKNTLDVDSYVSKQLEKAGTGVDGSWFTNVPAALKFQMGKAANELERAKLDFSKIVIPDGKMTDVIVTQFEMAKRIIKEKWTDMWDQFRQAFNTDGNKGNTLAAVGINEEPGDYTGLTDSEKQAKQSLRFSVQQLQSEKTNLKPDDKRRAEIDESIRKMQYIADNFLKAKDTSWMGMLAHINDNTGAGFNLSDLVGMNAGKIATLANKAERARILKANLGAEGASQNPNAEGWKAELRQIEQEVGAMKLSIVPKSFSDIVSRISGAGAQIDMQKALRMDPENLKEMNTYASEIEKVNYWLSQPGLGQDAYKDFGKRLLVLNDQLDSVVDKARSYKDRFDFVNNMFSDAAINTHDWASATKEQRDELYGLAVQAKELNKQIDRLPAGSAEGDVVQKKLEDVQLKYKAALSGALTGSGAIMSAAQLAGVQLDEGMANRFNGSDKAGFQGQLQSIFSRVNALRTNNTLTPEQRAAIQMSIDQDRKNITDAMAHAAIKPTQDSLALMGQNIDPKQFAVIPDAAREGIDKLLKQMSVEYLRATNSNSSEDVRIAAANMYERLNIELTDALTKLTMTRYTSPAYQAGVSMASDTLHSFIGAISDTIRGKSSVKDMMTSWMDTFTNNILDSFFNGMFKALTGKDGMLNKMLGGLFESVFSFGSGLFGGNTSKEDQFAAVAMQEAANAMNALVYQLSGGQYGSPMGNPGPTIAGTQMGSDKPLSNTTFSDSVDKLKSAFTDGQMDLGTRLATAFSGVGGMIQASIMSLMSVFTAGGGGGDGGLFGALFSIGTKIAGSFSGGGDALTSDLLANSGFTMPDYSGITDSVDNMVADASTFPVDYTDTPALNLPEEFKFAPRREFGGLVPGATGEAVPVLAHGGEVILNKAQQLALLKGGTGEQSQTFNINITGDVSRQTRTEIQQMIPQIAAGVNQHNYEQGIRR